MKSRKNGADEPICRAGTEMQMWSTGLLNTEREREGGVD